MHFLKISYTLCEELDKITEIEYNGDVMSDEYKKEYYEFLNYAAAIKELELFNGYTKERAADVLAGQIKTTADAIAFGLGLAASFAAPGLATVILTSAGFAVDAGTTAFCYAIGDDEEAQQRVIGMAMDGAFESLGAVSKYADDVADLTDDTFGSVYKKKTAFESSEYVDDIDSNTDYDKFMNAKEFVEKEQMLTVEETTNGEEFVDGMETNFDNEIVIDEKGYNDYLNEFGYGESAGRYDVVNQYNYMGKYQIGYEALKDIGYVDYIGNDKSDDKIIWTTKSNQMGIYNKDDFLNNVNDCQEKIKFELDQKYWIYLKKMVQQNMWEK